MRSCSISSPRRSTARTTARSRTGLGEFQRGLDAEMVDLVARAAPLGACADADGSALRSQSIDHLGVDPRWNFSETVGDLAVVLLPVIFLGLGDRAASASGRTWPSVGGDVGGS